MEQERDIEISYITEGRNEGVEFTIFSSCSTFNLNVLSLAVDLIERDDGFAIRDVEAFFRYTCTDQNFEVLFAEVLYSLQLICVFLFDVEEGERYVLFFVRVLLRVKEGYFLHFLQS